MMCAVSNVGDYWGNQFPNRYPWIQPWPYVPIQPYVPFRPGTGGTAPAPPLIPWIPSPVRPDSPMIPWVPKPVDGYVPTKEDFDKLRREIEELKLLLKAAKRYDAENGEPNCELDEKIEHIKQVAKYVGVDISDIFPSK